MGIYDELINSIKSINGESLKLLFSGNLKAFWQYIHANFLFSILLGIGISVFSLAKVITWLLVAHPVLVWSFFFGLSLGFYLVCIEGYKRMELEDHCRIRGRSNHCVLYYHSYSGRNFGRMVVYFYLWSYCYLCNDTSGYFRSFILVLLGKYFFIMEAVKTLNIKVMLIFAAGAFIGITTFSRVLSYALKNFRNITLAVLTGFMLGSLNKVWPWKEKIETMADGHIIELESNILPSGQVWEAVALALIGFFSVYFLEKLSTKASR